MSKAVKILLMILFFPFLLLWKLIIKPLLQVLLNILKLPFEEGN